jgi:hypothetical protein
VEWFLVLLASARAFLGVSISDMTNGVTGFGGCELARKNFTRGVPIETELSLSTFGKGAFGDAMAEVFGLEFFDPSMNPASNVSFTLEEVPPPEPSVAFSLVCGLLVLVVLKRCTAQHVSKRG